MITSGGAYWYIPCVYDPVYGLLHGRWNLPIITFLIKTVREDIRQEIAEASEAFLSSAPLMIVPVLDLRRANRWDDLSGERFRWIWFYEAGACAHNVLLEATAWNLSGNIATIHNPVQIMNALHLNDNFIPLLVIPVGK